MTLPSLFALKIGIISRVVAAILRHGDKQKATMLNIWGGRKGAHRDFDGIVELLKTFFCFFVLFFAVRSHGSEAQPLR